MDAGHPLYKEFLDLYDNLSFISNDGSLNIKTIVSYTSDILVKHGLGDDNYHPVNINGIWIYPADVFCPMDHTHGCKLNITSNTVSVHQYDSSWNEHTKVRMIFQKVKHLLIRSLEEKTVDYIRKIIR